MRNIRRYASVSVAWGALSVLAVGGAAYKTHESLAEQDEARSEYIVDMQGEIREYLSLLPSLRNSVDARRSLVQERLDEMELKLGDVCLKEMMTPTLPSSFDDALVTRRCDEYTATQLQDASVFYRPVRFEYDRLVALDVHLNDDPNNANDTVDTLRRYSGDTSYDDAPVTAVEESFDGPVIREGVTDEAVIVVPQGESYSTSTISNPDTAPTPQLPIHWTVGMVLGLVSLAGSISYGNRRRLNIWIIGKRLDYGARRHINDETKKFSQALDVDDEVLAQEIEALKDDLS